MRVGMRWMALAAVFLAAGIRAEEDMEALIDKLKGHISLGSVSKTDFRDPNDQKFEQVKLTTEQDEDDPFMGTLRFTVELTDRDGEVRWGQILLKQAKRPAEYEGRDEWTFNFPHGDLNRPAISAYALEYGWEANKVFTPVRQEFYKCESADEITARNKDPNKKLTIKATTKAFRRTSGGN